MSKQTMLSHSFVRSFVHLVARSFSQHSITMGSQRKRQARQTQLEKRQDETRGTCWKVGNFAPCGDAERERKREKSPFLRLRHPRNLGPRTRGTRSAEHRKKANVWGTRLRQDRTGQNEKREKHESPCPTGPPPLTHASQSKWLSRKKKERKGTFTLLRPLVLSATIQHNSMWIFLCCCVLWTERRKREEGEERRFVTW